MLCKLCLEDKELIGKSHIISNFLLKELLSDDGYILKKNLITGKVEKLYTGEFEKNILCANCDNNILGKLEAYGHRVLYTDSIKELILKNERSSDGAEWISCNGVDYKKFKLFLLSILWRLSISNLESYGFVYLDEYEDELRKMIINDDPGDVMDFPCFIGSYRRYNDLPFKILSQPMKKIINGNVFYTIAISGFVYNFCASKNLADVDIEKIVINKNNHLKILQIPKDHAKRIIENNAGLNSDPLKNKGDDLYNI